MVGLAHLAGGRLLLVLALLPLALDGKPAAPPQALHKAPAAPTAPSRIMWDLRPDSKQSGASWDRMVQPEPHTGGGGGRDLSRLQEQDNKGGADGCFGVKLDRIGTLSGLGCRRVTDPPPAPLAALRLMWGLRPDSKQSQAAWDRMVQPEPQAEGAGDSSRVKEDKKGGADGCFGLKLDRIGTLSGLGCHGSGEARPKPTPGGGL